MKLSYEELVKQVMVDGLEALRGTKIHTNDLSIHITEAMQDDTYSVPVYSQFDSYGDMVDFMTDNWEKSAKFYQDYKDNTCDTINIFEEPEKLVYLMVQDDIWERLDKTEFIEKYSEDGNVIFTDALITELKEELGLEDVKVSGWLRNDEEELER